MVIPAKKIVLGCLGGILPTLCKLATIYATKPETPMPQPGLYFGLGLFFMIGAVLALAFADDIADITDIKDIRQAVFVGIAAPAIIANIIAGASEAKIKIGRFEPISQAFAQAKETANQTANRGGQTLRNITVDTFIKGEKKFNLIDVDYIVAAIKKNREEKIVGIFSSTTEGNQEARTPSKNTFTIGADVTSLKIYMKNSQTTTVNLPNQFNSAKLEILLHVDKPNDLLWALGAKRKYDIIGIEAVITDIR